MAARKNTPGRKPRPLGRVRRAGARPRPAAPPRAGGAGRQAAAQPSPACPAALHRTASPWNEADSIRETTLQHFPDKRDRDALRHVGRLIYDLAVETDCLAVGPDSGRPETSSIHRELLAILLDLCSLGGYAAMVGQMAEGSSLPPADDALARFAGKIGKQLGATADAIAERLSRPLASPASHRSTPRHRSPPGARNDPARFSPHCPVAPWPSSAAAAWVTKDAPVSQPPPEGGDIGSSNDQAASPAPPAAAPRASRRQSAADAARPAPPTQAEVGLALAMIRQWRGLTQRALAAKTHTTPRLLSRYEAAKVDMTLGTLMKILDALDVEPEYFFRVARARTRQLSEEQPAEIEPVDLRRALHQLHGAIDDLRQLVDRFAAGGRLSALMEKILAEKKERRSPP